MAVGKLGLALSDGRPARLVVDSSICGVNSRCKMPDKSTLPTARDILRAYPLRASNRILSGFSLDIKSAHKRMAVHPDHRGSKVACHCGRSHLFFLPFLPPPPHTSFYHLPFTSPTSLSSGPACHCGRSRLVSFFSSYPSPHITPFYSPRPGLSLWLARSSLPPHIYILSFFLPPTKARLVIVAGPLLS